MRYAIVQKELVVPELVQLQRAFAVAPWLTSLDAQTAFHDAYGILLRGVETESAQALCAALRHEGVETEMVEESRLPAIPRARVGRQAEIQPSHLTLFDSMRHASEIPWSDIMFIAAGYVRLREAGKSRVAATEPVTHTAGISQDIAIAAKPREEEHHHLLLEIFLRDGAIRHSITADEFAFDLLGARRSHDLSVNFVLLLQELAERAPHAGLNRGAFKASQHPPELFPYPSKAAFNEEIIWMLWRIGRLASASDAEV
jgi:hypothetical protein